LRAEVIKSVNFGHYTLGAYFCRQNYSHGGVCILVSKDIQFHTINLDQFDSIYFAFVRSKRGFRPTGYRTCQLVYIIIYTKETTK
jgi:hypothetical protein